MDSRLLERGWRGFLYLFLIITLVEGYARINNNQDDRSWFYPGYWNSENDNHRPEIYARSLDIGTEKLNDGDVIIIEEIDTVPAENTWSKEPQEEIIDDQSESRMFSSGHVNSEDESWSDWFFNNDNPDDKKDTYSYGVGVSKPTSFFKDMFSKKKIKKPEPKPVEIYGNFVVNTNAALVPVKKKKKGFFDFFKPLNDLYYFKPLEYFSNDDKADYYAEPEIILGDSLTNPVGPQGVFKPMNSFIETLTKPFQTISESISFKPANSPSSITLPKPGEPFGSLEGLLPKPTGQNLLVKPDGGSEILKPAGGNLFSKPDGILPSLGNLDTALGGQTNQGTGGNLLTKPNEILPNLSNLGTALGGTDGNLFPKPDWILANLGNLGTTLGGQTNQGTGGNLLSKPDWILSNLSNLGTAIGGQTNQGTGGNLFTKPDGILPNLGNLATTLGGQSNQGTDGNLFSKPDSILSNLGNLGTTFGGQTNQGAGENLLSKPELILSNLGNLATALGQTNQGLFSKPDGILANLGNLGALFGGQTNQGTGQSVDNPLALPSKPLGSLPNLGGIPSKPEGSLLGIDESLFNPSGLLPKPDISFIDPAGIFRRPDGTLMTPDEAQLFVMNAMTRPINSIAEKLGLPMVEWTVPEESSASWYEKIPLVNSLADNPKKSKLLVLTVPNWQEEIANALNNVKLQAGNAQEKLERIGEAVQNAFAPIIQIQNEIVSPIKDAVQVTMDSANDKPLALASSLASGLADSINIKPNSVAGLGTNSGLLGGNAGISPSKPKPDNLVIDLLSSNDLSNLKPDLTDLSNNNLITKPEWMNDFLSNSIFGDKGDVLNSLDEKPQASVNVLESFIKEHVGDLLFSLQKKQQTR